MKQSKPVRRGLLALSSLALLFLTSSFVPARKATASGGSGGVETNYRYYTDATYTNGCGDKVIACNGTTFVWGCQTPYYTITYIEC